MTSQSLSLHRPLVIFDLETTGLDVEKSRIVEVAFVKIHTDNTRESYIRRVNPGVPIPLEATKIHGIANDDVANEPPFHEVADEICRFIADADLGGFNVERFDLPLLRNEFARTGMNLNVDGVHVIDVRKLYILKEPRDLSAAYRYYCDKTLENAHSAEADASATADILLAQLDRYPDLPQSIPELDAFCHPTQPDWVDQEGKIRWQNGQAVIAFGKHKNRSLEELARVERGYLQWVTSADFSSELVGIVANALKGDFPTQANGPAQ